MYLDLYAPMSDTTAVWIAKGNSYFAEAQRSMQSFKRFHKDVECICYTFEPHTPHTFDHVFAHYYDADKPFYFNLTKLYPTLADLNKRIFLFDTDTYTCAPLNDLYTLLQRFDFLGVHAPGRATCASIYNLPTAFPEINVGFLAFNTTGSVRQLLDMWYTYYVDHIDTYKNNDQGPLRDALFDWNGAFYVLPTEYNFRFGFGGQVRSLVRVLHGRSKDIERVAHTVNEYPNDFRSYRQGDLLV